jgi:hypothetical protein
MTPEEEKAQILDEVMAVLNQQSPLQIMAHDNNVVECVEKLIEMYDEAENTLSQIHDQTRYF